MSPCHESELPAVLLETHLAQLLGMPRSSMRAAMKRPNWPFSELPRIGRARRWSREQVLATINHGPFAARRRTA